ncbi:MAG: heme NO-binding domain-containing protein [Pseudomonadota bacterium]
MHGVVFSLLKSYVTEKHNAETWRTLLREAGREDTIYVPTRMYPDEEIVALVGTACRMTSATPEAVLEDFGIFIAPHLKGMYASLVDPQWHTMELLLNVEDTIHRVVRLKNPDARPPQLRFTRLDDSTLRFEYNSQRRMAALAVGIMKGIAKGYGEVADIQVDMHPDGSCEMLVRISKAHQGVA